MLHQGPKPTIEFVPDDEARLFVSDGLRSVTSQLGAPAQFPRLLSEQPQMPRSLDELFDLICSVQAEVGQTDVEFTLLELDQAKSPLPDGFEPLGDAQGHMLHTFHRGDEFVLLFMPAMMRLEELVFASIARELGRIGLHRAQGEAEPARELAEIEARAELAGVALGMGVWVANGSYVFENACCGGGCGIDLGSVRAELSMPEACFALALDARRKGLSRRAAGRHLCPTQRAAFKASWSQCKKSPDLALPAAGHAQLGVG